MEGDLLEMKLLSPLKVAVMECVPDARVETVKEARPVTSRALVPRVELPSLKVTMPVGTPVPGEMAVTLAVMVTAWLE
jgi:hypothetical protein